MNNTAKITLPEEISPDYLNETMTLIGIGDEQITLRAADGTVIGAMACPNCGGHLLYAVGTDGDLDTPEELL